MEHCTCRSQIQCPGSSCKSCSPPERYAFLWCAYIWEKQHRGRESLAFRSEMSDRGSVASLLSRTETRYASTGLLVIGVVLGGSAVSAAFWLRSRRALSRLKNPADRSAVSVGDGAGRQFICVLDGLSKPCRRDAVEVATCFGVTDIWVCST